jgi:protein AroM
LSERLGADVEIVQRGALDGVSIDLIRTNPPSSAETTLVSRLTDGTEVVVEKSFVVPRLREQIRSLEELGISLILLLCTHKFEDIESGAILLRPADALERIVERSEVRRLGVFTPSENQISAQRIRWQRYASDEVRVVSASPYLEQVGIEKAAAALNEQNVDVAVLDCIGYTENMRSIAQAMLNRPVFSAVSALGDVAAEQLRRSLREQRNPS